MLRLSDLGFVTALAIKCVVVVLALIALVSAAMLEDIVWDKFGGSDDHIVPHPGDEQVDECAAQGDHHKKPLSEVVSVVTKSGNNKYAAIDVTQGKDKTCFSIMKDEKDPMLEKGSWSHTPDGVFPASCDTDSIKEVTSLASDDTRISGHCFTSSNIDSIGNEFCADDPILSDGCAAVDNLWPDIGNFEDVDKMFRSCDSTFGQGNVNNDNELSWFSPSSHFFDGSEDALKAGFKSSCSESSALQSTSEHHETAMKYMPNSARPLINDAEKQSVPNTYKTRSLALDADEPVAIGHSSYTNLMDVTAENKEFMSMRQINLQRKRLKHKNQSEGNRKDQHSEYLSGGSFCSHGTLKQFAVVDLPSVPSPQQVFPSPGPQLQQQKQNLETDSLNYLHTYIPYVHLEYSRPSDQILVTPAPFSIKSENKGHFSLSRKASSHACNHVQTMERFPDPLADSPAMTPDKNTKKLHQQQEVQATLNIDPRHEDLVQAAFTDQVPVEKLEHQVQNEDHSDVEEACIPAVEVDSSTVQESSCMSSVLGEISVEATSFQQLQYVMEQLDIRTKLCIRESLYRLARSAEHRHNFGNSNGGSRDGRDRSGVLTTEESNKCTGFMDMETVTNPIDRSIACLLFHRPSGPSTRPTNGALFLESHTAIRVSITNQPVMAENLVCQGEIGGGADSKLLITEQY
ncbi:hypothetical protein HHK36_004025 [Tetracentron sinense]|uniref:Protein LNK1 n=1 Tax=Tetracentron sinense TaxID=13715 RepID=A0A834ZPS8_TETSI|nr:hypothetical protein HHK36_004025 [Tetracentron sinense]